MPIDVPRIMSVATLAADTSEPFPTRLIGVVWRGDDAGISSIELVGWVEAGCDVLKPLHDPAVFRRAAVGAHGSSVTWDGGEGDLSIDALHLHRMMIEQKRVRIAPPERQAWHNS